MAHLGRALTIYVADTMALARYLEGSLPSRADEAFREGEEGRARILIPSVALGELIYLALKGRLKVQDPKATLLDLVDAMAASPYLTQADMSQEAWRHLLELGVPELHDRMICALALAKSAEAIITKDVDIAASGIKTLW